MRAVKKEGRLRLRVCICGSSMYQLVRMIMHKVFMGPASAAAVRHVPSNTAYMYICMRMYLCVCMYESYYICMYGQSTNNVYS